ncbi:PGPGW domain-containing protein [Kitasatospora sp. MBT63]|uniref:PGPGW domain-containing protein n=1 Tax=Kitasatospora sp. MBT63 TaxID=1444768 RepID=UPI00053B5D66|nr:PGPGW domain-containing protein [Kitasatospora sp. MBT63]
MRHPLARAVLAVGGGFLVVVGVILLVLPGPGLLLVLAGLILFSRAVPAVTRYVEPVRVRAMQGAEASVASRWRILGSVLAGLGLIGAGVLWGLLAGLPFSGWSTGSSLILSGTVLLVLLVWSHRRVHGNRR